MNESATSYLWKLIRHNGIPQKIINLIKAAYKDIKCGIIHEGKHRNFSNKKNLKKFGRDVFCHLYYRNLTGYNLE